MIQYPSDMPRSDRSSEIDAAIGNTVPALLHLGNTTEPDLVRRQLVRFQLSSADFKLLDTLRKQHDLSWSKLVTRILWMICRTIRTGRDPHTGFPVNWTSAVDSVPDELKR